MPAISPLAGLRILVVDDEFAIASYIDSLLQDLRCDVLGPVGTIEEALGIVRNQRLDGAVLDARLHGRSSAPVADELVACSIPFVVVTGYGHVPLQSAALDDAPRLTKPFKPRAFEDALTATFVRLSKM